MIAHKKQGSISASKYIVYVDRFVNTLYIRVDMRMRKYCAALLYGCKLEGYNYAC